ncbi:MAG: hypothetical protein QMB12_09965 [Cyclobacteriaceae bacterium]|jgi:hypothetical protein|tara:strand:- start:1871 stop:2047 length:177 start_codon:yes stop_codon:yes gene_type:complete
MNKAHIITFGYQYLFNERIHPTADTFVFTFLGLISTSLVSQDFGQAEATETYFSVKAL